MGGLPDEAVLQASGFSQVVDGGVADDGGEPGAEAGAGTG